MDTGLELKNIVGGLFFRILFLLGVLVLFGRAHAAPIQSFADETYVVRLSRLWTEASRYGEPMAVLQPGVKLKVLSYSTSGAWIRVITPANREGWLPVKFTSFAGRRGKPVVPETVVDNEMPSSKVDDGFTDPVLEGERTPSSLPVETPSESSVAGGKRRVSALDLELGVGYVNQLSRASASGLSAGLAIYKNFSSNWSGFVGFDYVMAKESSQSDVATTSRSTTDLAPYLGFKWSAKQAASGFEMAMGLGWMHDLTSLETRDLTTGDLIMSDGGLITTGSGSGNALLLKWNPSYAVALGAEQSLKFGLNYSMYVDLSSGEGTFAATPTSKVQHNLGVGLSYLQGF